MQYYLLNDEHEQVHFQNTHTFTNSVRSVNADSYFKKKLLTKEIKQYSVNTTRYNCAYLQSSSKRSERKQIS